MLDNIVILAVKDRSIIWMTRNADADAPLHGETGTDVPHHARKDAGRACAA